MIREGCHTGVARASRVPQFHCGIKALGAESAAPSEHCAGPAKRGWTQRSKTSKNAA
jgi:hypothetical protein